MNLMKILLPLWLSKLIATQNWNYTLAGADWNGKYCNDPNNLNQSPIDIDLSACECNDQMNLELNFIGTLQDVSKTQLKLSGNPPTFRMSVSPQFAHLYLKTSSEKSRFYRSQSYLFRTPSEHSLDGKNFPLELQIYFSSIYDEPLALSILYDYSDQNSTNVIFKDFLSSLNSSQAWNNQTIKTNNTMKEYINYNKLFLNKINFFQYNGTNTDTDCGQSLKWVILTDVLFVNQSDITTFQNILVNSTSFNSNARMQQDINNRTVYVSNSNCSDFFSNILWFSFLYGCVIFFVFKML